MRKFLLGISAFLLGVTAFCQETGTTGTVTSKGTSTSTIGASSPEFKMNLPLPELDFLKQEKTDSVYYFIPSILFEETPLVLNPNHVPFIRNYETAGLIGSWNGFNLIGTSSYEEHPFLVTTRSAGVVLTKAYGPLSIMVKGEVNHYAGMPLYSMYQFGVGGKVTWRISPAASITAFADIYNVNPSPNNAAYAFMNTSQYGGYVTLQSDRVGVDLGVREYYDPMRQRWEVAPIVTPKIKIGEVEFGIPVGGLIKNQVDRANFRNHPPTQQTPPTPPPAEPKRHW